MPFNESDLQLQSLKNPKRSIPTDKASAKVAAQARQMDEDVKASGEVSDADLDRFFKGNREPQSELPSAVRVMDFSLPSTISTVDASLPNTMATVDASLPNTMATIDTSLPNTVQPVKSAIPAINRTIQPVSTVNVPDIGIDFSEMDRIRQDLRNRGMVNEKMQEQMNKQDAIRRRLQELRGQ